MRRIFGHRPIPQSKLPQEINPPVPVDLDRPSISCPRCGLVSYHPKDIEERYCANCHMWHDDMVDRPYTLTKKVDHLVELRTNLRALTYGEKMGVSEALSKIVEGKLSPEELAAALYKWTQINGD